MKIVLIGAGNVASGLGLLLKKNGHKILQVYNRSARGKILARKLKCGFVSDGDEIIISADLYIVAVKDDAISSVVRLLRFKPALVVHTSGSVDMNVFPKRFASTGVLYPVMTFSGKDHVQKLVPFCIEGNNKKSLSEIEKLAKSVSTNVKKMNGDERRLVHLCAVITNNFTNHLYAKAAGILKSNKIDFSILHPLILETALRIQNDNPSHLQTGPAKRGDKIILRKHISLLKSDRSLQRIYKLMSKSIGITTI